VAEQSWSLFTNHAVVLAYVVEQSDRTVREIASEIGLTERATLSILGDLSAAGIVDRHRQGRSNTYSLDFERLAMFRRSNSAPPTPTTFANGLIGTLLDVHRRKNPAVGQRAPSRPSHAAGLPSRQDGSWGFYTNHLRVLLTVADDCTRTVHQIADYVGITERAVVAILNQLEAEGLLTRQREGRRNSYKVNIAAFDGLDRWSTSPWPMPQAIIDVSTAGVRALAERSGALTRLRPAKATGRRADTMPRVLRA
jgi:DNA-binding MarR family transcriptional regulator